MTADGSGDGMSSTVYVGKDGELANIIEVPTFHSIAYYYGYITIIAGFKMFRHEGKITGLAAYGKPRKTYGIFEKYFDYNQKTGWPENTLKLIGEGKVICSLVNPPAIFLISSEAFLSIL